MYDLYVPVVEGVEMKFTFEEAKEIALKALAPLGEDYLALIREGFENRWIDVYENEGKRSGAYSAGARVHPYVLLNFKGTLDDVFTLVHEMGHSIHSYLSNTRQPTAYQDYVIFVAEVASTCNEALLMEYLLSVTTDKKGTRLSDQPLPRAVPRHTVPPDHVRGVRAGGERDDAPRRGHDRRRAVRSVQKAE